MAKDDECKDNMLIMLDKQLPQYSIKAVASGAYNADIHYPFCKYMIKNDYRPEFLIVPVNMRSFSPEWDRNPNYQFEEERSWLAYDSYLFRLFYRPLSVFKLNKREISQQDFENSPVYDGGVEAGRVRDFINITRGNSDDNMKKKLVFYYMQSLSEQCRKVQSLIKMARLLRRTDINVIFYITPVNYQICEKYLGSRATERLRENTQVVKTALEREGCEVMDLSVSLDKKRSIGHIG